MSDFSAETDRWRGLGLPKYLARCLGVTEKTVSRWCDARMVPGAYRTSKGHRRIRYTDTTVEIVRLTVYLNKETKRTIAKGEPINWCGRHLETSGCRTMNDLYHRALESGFNEREARMVAYVPRGSSGRSADSVTPEEIWFELAHTAADVLAEDACGRRLPIDPEEQLQLANTASEEEFRELAQLIWNNLLENYEQTELSFDGFAEAHTEEGFAEAKALLHMPSKAACFERLDALNSPGRRPFESGERVLAALQQFSRANQSQAFLLNEALKLRLRQLPLSASELANVLQISRRKLYRDYGTRAIQAALNAAKKGELSRFIQSASDNSIPVDDEDHAGVRQAAQSRTRNLIGDAASC